MKFGFNGTSVLLLKIDKNSDRLAIFQHTSPKIELMSTFGKRNTTDKVKEKLSKDSFMFLDYNQLNLGAIVPISFFHHCSFVLFRQ